MGELEGGGGPATDSPAISKDKQHATSAFSSSQPFFSSIFSALRYEKIAISLPLRSKSHFGKPRINTFREAPRKDFTCSTGILP